MKFEHQWKMPSISRFSIKRNWIAVSFALIVVEILLFLLGNQYYGMIVIPFFFLVILLHPRNFPLLLVSILVIVLLNTPVVNSWEKFNSSTSEIYHNPTDWLENIFTPKAGEKVLPDQVRYMLFLARAHPIPNYRLEDTYQNDGTLYQRVIEGMWPLRVAATSPYFFCPAEQMMNHPACSVIDRREDVVLAYCH